ncbi:MAG: tetratricopeptide repeat protein [Erythrobacter sp.]|uniref:tetratricopeptide repeat protein n=1 Tax=Erythrobacter sp. TaxID=1042 RepID=UPI003297E5BD
MLRRTHMIAVLALASVVVTGCSSEPSTVEPVQLSGSEDFLRVVEDARRFVRQGDLASAGKAYDEAREIDPNNPGLWVEIARLRFLGGENLTAIEAADHALELQPNYGPALLLRAQMVRDANGMEEALPWFEAGNSADPGNQEMLGEYAATLGDLGFNRDMLDAVRDLAEFSPDNEQALYLQAVLAARGNNPAVAARLLERSRYLQNDVPAAKMLDAIINMQQGSYDTAANTLESLADEQPANMRVKELLAKAWWLGGRDDLIAEGFGETAKRPDASSYLVMLVGRAIERSGNREAAIPYIERANALGNGSSYVLTSEGGLPAPTSRLRGHVSAGNLSEARAVAASVVREFPQSGDAYSLAGDVALASGQPLAAIEAYQVSAKVRRSWPLTRKLTAAMLEAGESGTAKALLSRYIQGDPQNLDALMVLARLSAQEEDWLRVAVLLDTAIAHGAGSDPTALALRAQAARELGDEGDASQAEAMTADLVAEPFL